MFSRKVAFRVRDALRSATQEPSNRSLQFFYCRIITHRYTDFQSYLDFREVRDVPGFRSAGHISGQKHVKFPRFCHGDVQMLTFHYGVQYSQRFIFSLLSCHSVLKTTTLYWFQT